jgi:hypothetical protein
MLEGEVWSFRMEAGMAESRHWTVVSENSEILAVHAALLPSGKVLYFSGSEHDEAPPDPASRMNATRLWDPADNRVRRAGGRLPDDLFCSGHCLLPGGEVFVAGGTAHYDKDADPGHAQFDHFTGIASAIVFDWASERWHPVQPMAGGRWYPTCITLADGRVMVLGGHGGEYGPHENTRIEVFDPTDGTWSAPFATTPPLEDTGGETSILGNQIRPMVYYPRLHQLPDGRIFSSTPLRVDDERRTRALELSGRTSTDLGRPPLFGVDPLEPLNIYARSAFPSVLLPLVPPSYTARVLIFGQHQPYVFEPGNPQLGWREAGHRPRDPIRAYANSVLLPDATVLFVGGATSERLPIFGGGADSSAVHFAERYRPQTNTWEELSESPNRIARVYHSVALLLADGRVWIAGSNHDSDRNHGGVRSDDSSKGDARELRIEVYSPAYVFAPRPTIGERLVKGAGYGQVVEVETPDAGDIEAVHLVRCSSATHAFNSDQRLVVLEIVAWGANAIRVKMPPNGAVAPPGYYLLFILNRAGIPSVGRFLQLLERYPLVEVYLGRPLTWDPDVPDIPVGTDVLQSAAPVLDFGTLDLGQSRRARVGCKNVGSGTLRITASFSQGDFRTEPSPDLPISGVRGRPKNLNMVVYGSGAPPDEFVVLDLVFTPTEMGPHTGTLLVQTNAPDLGGFFVDLRANVVGFDVDIIPPVGAVELGLRFDSVAVGATAVLAVSIRNLGTLDAVINDVTIEDDSGSGEFRLASMAPAGVPAGQSRNLAVAFSPKTVALGPLGQAHAVLVVETASSPGPSRFSRRLTIGLHGVGTGPRVDLQPAGLAFGPQPIGTASPPQTMTIHNSGSGPLRITNIVASSDWRLDSQPPAAEILPGDAVQIQLAFRPGHAGQLVGTLMVDSNAPASPATAALEGTGVATPICALSPATLDFGDQAIGTHGLARAVKVMSNGAVDLQVTSVGLAGAHAGDFAIATNSCSGATIGPEQACSVDVLFTPTASGARSATLQVIDNATGSPHSVALSGTGTPPPARTVNPTAISFPGQAVESRSQPQRLTLTNNGVDPFTVARVETAGAAGGDFVLDQGCQNRLLVPGASCAVAVAFQPAAAGERNASIVVTDDAPGTPVAIPVTGVGLGADVVFDPPTLDLETQQVGTFGRRREVLLNNLGNADLGIAAITVTGDFRHDHLCGSILRRRDFCRIGVMFVPTVAGAHSGELRVTDDQGHRYQLPLAGWAWEPQASLSTASIEFGDLPVGSTSRPQSVRLSNVGTGVLTVRQVQVENGTTNDFLTDPQDCSGAVLRQGEACTTSVRFQPTSKGGHGAILKITTNARDSPHSVRLSGIGI